MYFTLAKNSKLKATSSTSDVVFVSVLFGDDISPSLGYIGDDITTYASAYIESIPVNGISVKNTSTQTVDSICLYIGSELLIPCFTLLSGQSVLINELGQEYQMVSPSVCTPSPSGCGCDNENIVTILDSNGVGIFTRPHGTLMIGTNLYIGTRGSLAPGSKSRLVHYPNYNDLSTYIYIEMPTSVHSYGTNIESICYDASTDKLIAALSWTKQLLVVNPADITDYTLETVVITNPFGESSPILADGLGSIYLTTSNTPDCDIVKINTTTFTVTSSMVWANVGYAHAGAINMVDNFLYLISNGFNTRLAKIDLSSFVTFTEYALDMFVTTDDCLFFPAGDVGNATNLMIVVGEGRDFGKIGQCSVVVDLDNLLQWPLDTMPGQGITFDYDTQKVIIVGVNGLIETIDIGIILDMGSSPVSRFVMETDVYAMRGYMPNEVFVTPDGYFVTSFDELNQPHLHKIELVKVDKPLMTKKEAEYRLTSYSTTDGGASPFSLQSETSGGASITIGATTTLLKVNPSSTIPLLDIGMPSSPTNGDTVGIYFGDTIPESEPIVDELTFSGGTFYQASTMTAARGGDYIEFKYVSSKWLRLK